MNNSEMLRSTQRSKKENINQHQNNHYSDSAMDADHSSPDLQRSYHRSSPISHLPPIAHRKANHESKCTKHLTSAIKSKRSDGGRSSESVNSEHATYAQSEYSCSPQRTQDQDYDVEQQGRARITASPYTKNGNPVLVTPQIHVKSSSHQSQNYTHCHSLSSNQSTPYTSNQAQSNSNSINRTNSSSSQRRTNRNPFERTFFEQNLDSNVLTSDEYEYDCYERGPRSSQSSRRSRFRNSSVKSRKAKTSPMDMSSNFYSHSQSVSHPFSNSRNMKRIYPIHALPISSSDSENDFHNYNSNSDLNRNQYQHQYQHTNYSHGHSHGHTEESSPLSSRSLFSSNGNCDNYHSASDLNASAHAHVNSTHKSYSYRKQFRNSALSFRNRYFKMLDKSLFGLLLIFLVATTITYSTINILVPQTIFIPRSEQYAHSADQHQYRYQDEPSSSKSQIRRAEAATAKQVNQYQSSPPRIMSLYSDVSISELHKNSHAYYQYEHGKVMEEYPAEFSDNTQLYGILDSSDPALAAMELREPAVQGECQPMADWQTAYHPSCNGLHEYDLMDVDEKAVLFGKKGYWRHAWHLEQYHQQHHVQRKEDFVLKTLKYEHNFEDAHFEHDRIDAIAMEMLTSSPHVINIYGFCGHSVITEYADEPRIGTLADKNKKNPKKLLEIARDIANGLADVHGMGKNGNEALPNAFVHLDINPANVVSIGGTLKLNDFNIGIMRKFNTTSKKPCGFPAQYPNPQVRLYLIRALHFIITTFSHYLYLLFQHTILTHLQWRSPEEAWESQNLNEKVDVYSMGHIFFRLICGHEPWNKLEQHGKPTKEEINRKVKKGGRPFVPDTVKFSTDPAVQAIYHVMQKCYRFKPENRPSAREVAKEIDRALQNFIAEEVKDVTKNDNLFKAQ